MPSVAVLAADGFETIECLTMVDVMRRGGVRATLVSIMPTREVVSSLQIPVTCDALFDEINFDEYDCVVLPGGLPGATNLRADQRVCDVVCEFAATKHVAAICAAPLILGELDLLEGRHATCFPGFEKSFPEGAYTGEKVTQDGNIITASGMAQSLPFALELLRTLAGDKAVEKVELMREAGYNIRVIPADIDETPFDGEAPLTLVERLARAKAAAVAAEYAEPNELTVAADTIVTFDGKILGKPATEDEARTMLRELSGRTHQVATGVCIVKAGDTAAPHAAESLSFVDVTDVTFYELTDEQIEHYVASGEPMDKAGAYGIQGTGGRMLVHDISGDFYNVVGLPIARVARAIQKLS